MSSSPYSGSSLQSLCSEIPACSDEDRKRRNVPRGGVEGGRDGPMHRVKCGFNEMEFPEIGEMAEELDKWVQSEGNIEKR